MPSFYPGGPDNVLGGKDDQQIVALRDYLMSIGKGAPAPAAGSAPGPSRPPAKATKVAQN
jgi:hypothetical protein